ncbi:MAG TPA: Gfo/Idh/MocA family oxidoreductase [Polyangiaceae bacterium]|jgi:predicted dehydrogenase
MIRAAVIGYGYWGPNIVRNFKTCGKIDLACVCDVSPQQLELVKKAHPEVRTTQSIAEVLADGSIDAVAIITPVATHFELGMQALAAGKHVWVEKPLTASSEEARQLCAEADKRNRVLFVDHTFIYTGAVRKLRELVAEGELGKLCCYDSVRSNLGLYRRDVNVLWDLAVHDLSIMDYALRSRVTAVSATGVANVPGMPESSAFMTCFLEGNALMHVHADWFSPVKGRTTTITGDRRMIVYDDNEAVEKVRVWDRGVDVTPGEGAKPLALSYRNGVCVAPELPKLEALNLASTHFAESIEQGKRPITDGELGFRIVQVLEAAIRSLKDRGRPVEL